MKKVLSRLPLGFVAGIAIGHVITVLISLIKNDGAFYPCVPEFISMIGSEANAAALQTLLCGIMGIGFSAGSYIWELENRSIAWQTGIAFLIYALSMLPIAYFANWMEHSLIGILSYCGIFVICFVVVWLIQFAVWRKKISSINSQLRK